jgi:hypothetical protein
MNALIMDTTAPDIAQYIHLYTSESLVEVHSCFGAMLVDLHQTPRHHIPEDSTLHIHCWRTSNLTPAVLSEFNVS